MQTGPVRGALAHDTKALHGPGIGLPQDADRQALPKRKVRVVHEAGLAGQQASTLRGTLAGHVYFRAPEWKAGDGRSLDQAYEAESETNLNCEVPFKDSKDLIECRHLALAVGQARSAYLQQKASGASVGRFSYEGFSAPEKLQVGVAPQLEALYDAVSSCPPSHHLVLLSEWGNFLEDQFKILKPGEHRHSLLTSVNHAMLLELQVKQKGDQSPQRVVLFYDPNQTVTHQRVVLDESTTRACRLHDFLSPSDLDLYFSSADSQRVTRVIDLTPDLLRSPPSTRVEQVPGDTKAPRLQASHAGDRCTVAEVRLRLVDSLADGLQARMARTLAQCDAREAFTLLQATVEDEQPGLHRALEAGSPEMVRAFVQNILDPRVPLSKAQRLELLLAQDDEGRPGLLTAIGRGQTAAARELVEAVLAAPTGFSSSDLLRFLTVKAGTADEDTSLLRLAPKHLDAAGTLRHYLKILEAPVFS